MAKKPSRQGSGLINSTNRFEHRGFLVKQRWTGRWSAGEIPASKKHAECARFFGESRDEIVGRIDKHLDEPKAAE